MSAAPGRGADKARVGRAFSRGAADYDAHAHVQRRAAARLLELCLPGLAPPRRLLDVGAGTGALLAELSARFPAALAVGVDLAPGMARVAAARARAARLAVGDAEALPFRPGAFDLVVSTSTLQWLPLAPALREAAAALAPGGTLAVALFGGDTLCELRQAWREALPPGAADGTHRFHGAADLEAAVTAAGLRPARVASERLVERHADPLALVRALKRIGAGTAAPSGLPGLGAGAALGRMATAYARRHGGPGPGGVPATWEILYAVARAPAA